MDKLLMIVNPKAGRSKSRSPLFDASALLSQAGYLLSVHVTTGQGDATDFAARHGGEFDVVVAVGGDGTLSEVASGLMRLPQPPLLGYFPQGSTNDFAASLGLSSNPVRAAAALIDAAPQQLDLGTWNQRTFVYVASFGAFASSSYTAPQSAKNALGHFAYLLQGMLELDTLRPYSLRITADDEVLDGKYLFGAICNSTSIGGLMKLSHDRVVLDDGRFELLLIPQPTTLEGLNQLMVSLLNQQYHQGGLVFRHVSSVHIETDEEIPWSLDGEFAPSAPSISIVNHPRALRMLL